MKIILMGPQASGKGTQGELLSAKLNIPAISVGHLLRSVTPDHPRYPQIQNDLVNGRLVEDQLTAQIILDRISFEDCQNGFILDGWGRRMADINIFDPNFDYCLNIQIPYDESLRRITGRRTCSTDGKTYNINTFPEEAKKCKGELIQRADDTEEAVRTRLNIYYTETQEVIEHFRSQNKLIEVDGLGSIDEVFARILKALSI